MTNPDLATHFKRRPSAHLLFLPAPELSAAIRLHAARLSCCCCWLLQSPILRTADGLLVQFQVEPPRSPLPNRANLSHPSDEISASRQWQRLPWVVLRMGLMGIAADVDSLPPGSGLVAPFSPVLPVYHVCQRSLRLVPCVLGGRWDMTHRTRFFGNAGSAAGGAVGIFRVPVP